MDYKNIFNQKLKDLNQEQLEAVNYINGPLMVVAGPGTGKTELLAMRVANILEKTDASPDNILCLTFTDAASANMINRLSSIIGVDAHKVNIATFHKFGSDIMANNSEYFFSGADVKPADNLTTRDIVNSLIAKLDFSSKLRSKRNGEFTHTKDIQKTISDFKRAGISPKEAQLILAQNINFCEAISDCAKAVFSQKVAINMIKSYEDLLNQATSISAKFEQFEFSNQPTLAEIFCSDLRLALSQAKINKKTATITKFKNSWLKAIASDFYQKTLDCVKIYEQYLEEMSKAGLYDFDDMIMKVIEVVENRPSLKSEMQEQYQYILVDEFQDTNDAQMRLLKNLTDYDDQPNLMVVGDDDQAIYRFQGADIGNIQSLKSRLKDIKQINLHRNYRSNDSILKASSVVAKGITNRLLNVDGTDKFITSEGQVANYPVERFEAVTFEHEIEFVVSEIEKRIDAGENPSNIAIISRKHNTLEEIAKYLSAKQIKVNYEKQRNIFRSEIINLVINLVKIVNALSSGNSLAASAILPEIIAHPAFGFSSEDFYSISLKGREYRSDWIKALDGYNQQTNRLLSWLKDLSMQAKTFSATYIIGSIVGLDNCVDAAKDGEAVAFFSDNDADKLNYKSPILSYYFGLEKLNSNSLAYLGFLNDIKTLLTAFDNFKPNQNLKINDLVEFIDKSMELAEPIYSTLVIDDGMGVQLMTAHKSKGMEFDTVFIVNAESNIWGNKARSNVSKIALPANMPYRMSEDKSDDEKRRLLFVAMTRAKKHLIITSHKVGDGGKELIDLEYILHIEKHKLNEPDPARMTDVLESSLFSDLCKPTIKLKSLLSDRLARYRLSATDLNSFTDLVYSGPDKFLLYNLLGVPQGMSVNLIFGSAMHHVMQKAHNTMITTGKLIETSEAIKDFEDNFNDDDLDQATAKAYLDKGTESIKTYFSKMRGHFNANQKAEQSLEANLDGVKLVGKIDCMEVDHKNYTIKIVDYKTGKAINSLSKSSGGWNEKIKAINYRYQLMFYKLLVENSKKYSDYKVVEGSIQFIEPVDGEIIALYLDYDNAEIEVFKKLISSVWRHIMALNIPNVSAYSPDLSGRLEFESYLIGEDTKH